jgi:hypothetical protein
VLYSIQTRADLRGICKICIHVAAGESVLDVQAGAAADDAEPGGAVVTTPDDVDRSPAGDRVAFV